MSKIRKKKGNIIFDISKLNNALRNIDKDNIIPQSRLFNNMCYKIPGTQVNKNVYDLTSKDIYNILSDNYVEIKSKTYWQGKFQNVQFDFDVWFSNLFMSCVMPNKILDFNWRIFHGQVLTEKRLFKMKMSNGICIVCKKEIEDIFHLLLFCEHVQYIWNFVEKVTSIIESNNVNLTVFKKMIGNIEKEDKFDLYNLIVSIVRWEIWKYRCYLKRDVNAVRYNIICKIKLAICEKLNMLQMSKVKVNRAVLNNLLRHINKL